MLTAGVSKLVVFKIHRYLTCIHISNKCSIAVPKVGCTGVQFVQQLKSAGVDTMRFVLLYLKHSQKQTWRQLSDPHTYLLRNSPP